MYLQGSRVALALLTVPTDRCGIPCDWQFVAKLTKAYSTVKIGHPLEQGASSLAYAASASLSHSQSCLPLVAGRCFVRSAAQQGCG